MQRNLMNRSPYHKFKVVLLDDKNLKVGGYNDDFPARNIKQKSEFNEITEKIIYVFWNKKLFLILEITVNKKLLNFYN